MLRVVDRFADDDNNDGLVPPPAKLSLVRPDDGARPELAMSRYGGRHRLNLPAVVFIILIHALVIAALIQVRHHVLQVQERRLSVVNLMPPPPPPAAATPPQPSPPKVVVPPPLVQVPLPSVPQLATTPDPVAVPVTVAPVSTPAPVAAPVMVAPPSIVQGGDIGTQMVAGKPPRYPIGSRRKREQGTVVLTLTLGLDGSVESLSITQSSGFARLDDAARDAVRGWRWKPMVRDGQPVRVRGVVEIPFILRGESA